MSLPSLRERLANLRKRKDEEQRHTQNADTGGFETPSLSREISRSNNTADFKPVISPVLLNTSPAQTDEITDHPSWLARIRANGHTPEDWLQYTNYVRDSVIFSDKDARNEYLSNIYTKAVKAISPDNYKRNLAYAQLLINFALFKREDDPEEARQIMAIARINTKYFAIVHIAAAQMDIWDGKRDKAKKILDKALDFDICQKELLQAALRNWSHGAHVLVSQEELLKYEELNRLNEPVEKSSPLNHLTENEIMSISNNHMSTNHTDDLLHPKKSWTGNISLGNTTLSELLRPKSSARQVDNTTLEIATTDLSISKWSDSVFQRGLEPDLSSEKNEDLNGHLLFKPPLPAAPRAPSLITTPLSTPCCNEVNKPSMMDSVISFRGDSRARNQSGNTSDENDTIPFVNDRRKDASKKSMKSYHSTPDCTTASAMSSESKRFQGLARRVKRTSLPQISGAFTEKDDTDNIHLEPLPEYDSSSADEEGFNLRKKSTCSDSGVMTGAQSMDYAILESSDEHKPMETYESTAGRSKNTEDMETSVPSLHRSDILHQNITYSRVRSGGRSNGDNNSLGHASLVSQTAKSSHITTAKPSALVSVGERRLGLNLVDTPNSLESRPSKTEMPKPHQDVFATPLQKSKRAEVSNPSLLAPTPGYQVPLKAPMVTPMGKQLEVLTIHNKYYSVLKTIGRGGSSKVYEVLDESSNLRAVKVVNMEDADDETIASYKNEIDLLQRLQYSDRIIKMYDFEYQEENKRLFVVMEKGDTDLAALFKSRNKHGNITEGMRKFYWEEMLKAVQVLQNEGIVHSDLKPPNFLLVAGHLKLIDFGIAKAIQPEHTSAIRDQQVGTLNYISPEAVNDLSEGTQTDERGNRKPKIKIGVKSDVWSLGCILYNMVYARTPFQKYHSQIQKLQALLNPRCVIDFPDLPDRHLLDVLKRCLRWDPKERPSIDDLLSHPYITGKQESAATQRISGLSDEAKQRLRQEMASSSPRTASAVFDGFLEQLQSGKEIDVNSILKRTFVDGSPQLKNRVVNPAQSTKQDKENLRVVPRAPFQPHNF